MATTCVRGDNNTACGRKDPRRIFYQQRTGRKGHGSNSSQSEGPINIAARHTDVRWIAMPGPNGTMKPTKPNSNSNQTQTKTGTEQNRDRTEHPATPTRSFISRPRRNPFRKSATESSPWLCSHSSELNTSPRIVSNPARLSKPLCEFLLRAGRLATYQASTRALESAVSRQVWPILRFPARIANFFSESIPANRLNASDTRSLHVACQAGPPRLQAAAHCTNSPQKFGSSALSVGPPGAIKPAAPRSTAFHGRQKILCHRPATGIFFRAGAIHWSIPSGFILGR